MIFRKHNCLPFFPSLMWLPFSFTLIAIVWKWHTLDDSLSLWLHAIYANIYVKDIFISILEYFFIHIFCFIFFFFVSFFLDITNSHKTIKFWHESIKSNNTVSTCLYELIFRLICIFVKVNNKCSFMFMYYWRLNGHRKVWVMDIYSFIFVTYTPARPIYIGWFIH